jgi:outer membrane lipoprotein-sorting protein
MAKDKSLKDILAELDEKQKKIKDLMNRVQGLIVKESQKTKMHAKRIVKEGMSAYFEGTRKNPYKKGTDENEWWDYGFSISKDTWFEMKS